MPDTVRIVHAADIHLDSPLTGLSRLGERGLEQDLRSATRRAFGNLIQLCRDEEADLLVLAGDVYDGDCDSFTTSEYLVSRLRELTDEGVQVALVHGNHDAESQITRRLTMPAGVHVLATDRPETKVLDDLGVAVHGQGYAVRDVFDDLVSRYPMGRAGLVNIGLLHTGLAGTHGHAPYAPCSADQLADCGYDYFALGHVHQRQQVVDGRAPAWFSGNLQGRHPRETGPKGALVVDLVPGGEATVRFATCDVARWATVTPDLSACTDIDSVVEAMDSRYRAALGEAGGLPLVVRFELTGETSAAKALLLAGDRLDAEARSLIRAGGALDRVRVDVHPPDGGLEADAEFAALLRHAAEDLASDPDAVRTLLHDLSKQGAARIARAQGVNLDDEEALGALVKRAGAELSAILSGEA